QGVNRLPGPADDVVINGVDQGATVTHARNADIIHTLTSDNAAPYNLALTGGSLALAGDPTGDLAPNSLNANTAFVLGHGTLGLNADIDFLGSVELAGGTMSDLGAGPGTPSRRKTSANHRGPTRVRSQTKNVSRHLKIKFILD